MLQAEYLEPRDRHWMSGILCPGVARSNDGMECHFKHFKKEEFTDARQVYDLIISVENMILVISLTVNEDHVKKVMLSR